MCGIALRVFKQYNYYCHFILLYNVYSYSNMNLRIFHTGRKNNAWNQFRPFGPQSKSQTMIFSKEVSVFFLGWVSKRRDKCNWHWRRNQNKNLKSYSSMLTFSSLRHPSSCGLLFSAFPATLRRLPGSCCSLRVLINHTPFPP